MGPGVALGMKGHTWGDANRKQLNRKEQISSPSSSFSVSLSHQNQTGNQLAKEMLGWRLLAPHHREEYWSGCVAENNSLITWILSSGGYGICKVWYTSWYNPPTKGILLKTMASLKHVLEAKEQEYKRDSMLFCLHPPSSNGLLHLPPAPSPGPTDRVNSVKVRALICGLPLQTLTTVHPN